jgi:hypothetical protein
MCVPNIHDLLSVLGQFNKNYIWQDISKREKDIKPIKMLVLLDLWTLSIVQYLAVPSAFQLRMKHPVSEKISYFNNRPLDGKQSLETVY